MWMDNGRLTNVMVLVWLGKMKVKMEMKGRKNKPLLFLKNNICEAE